MATLELSQIVKTYPNGFKALKGIDVAVKDGEMLVVVGPSGCGKSTLLRCVAGLERITSGEIVLDGESIAQKRPDERDIAMVFQNYALYPHMSVYDNLGYGLRNRKFPADKIKELINEAAGILHIEELLDRRPAQLSGGQRQRVAMGRAIVRHPKVFLFDEPLSNLDAKLRGHMRVEIKRLQRRQNATAMFVTHDQVEAMTLGDRIILLNDGEVEQVGTPDDLYYRPSSTYVASFIGSPPMNLLDGRQTQGEVKLEGVQMQSPLEDTPVKNVTDVIVGLRPNDIEVVEREQAHVLLEVDVIEPLGDLMLVHGKIDSKTDLTVQLASREHKITAGEQLPLRFDTSSLHYFDRGNGRRI